MRPLDFSLCSSEPRPQGAVDADSSHRPAIRKHADKRSGQALMEFALAWGSATADPIYSAIADSLTIRILGPQIEMKYQMA